MNSQDLKPALCILNPDEVYDLKHHHAKDSYYCITPHEVLELQSQGVSFPVEPHLQEGLVLTRKPQGMGYYYRTDGTDLRIINDRCLAIEDILSYLGGKEFRYSETSSFRSKQVDEFEGEIGVKKGGVNVGNNTEIKKNTENGKNGYKTLESHWSGNYTPEGYNKAVKVAEVNGLISDPDIASLLDQRRPSHPNPIAYRDYHVNVTEDLDKNIHVLEDISASLKDKIEGHLKVDVNTSRKIDQSATVDFFVSFGPIPVEVSQNPRIEENRVASRTKWLWIGVATAIIIAIGTVLAVVL